MDELKSGQLAMIFTESFLGAGFVSGQEILQLFGEIEKKKSSILILWIIAFAAVWLDLKN